VAAARHRPVWRHRRPPVAAGQAGRVMQEPTRQRRAAGEESTRRSTERTAAVSNAVLHRVVADASNHRCPLRAVAMLGTHLEIAGVLVPQEAVRCLWPTSSSSSSNNNNNSSSHRCRWPFEVSMRQRGRLNSRCEAQALSWTIQQQTVVRWRQSYLNWARGYHLV